MIFEPDEGQAVILSALDRLTARYKTVSTDQVVQRSVYSADLQTALTEGGFVDIGVDDPESALLSALVVAELSKLPFTVEVAASALVRAAVCPLAPGPVALLWGDPTLPTRFLAQARTAIIADGNEIRILEMRPGDAKEVESIFAFPMARLSTDAIARAKPLAGGSVETLQLWWRVAIALEMYGALHAAHKLTIEHVRDRHQFGRSLGSFQAVQHRLAMNATTIEAIRWLGLKAANSGLAADAGLAATYAQDNCKSVVYDLHQFNGAMGLTLEYSLHLFTYRANYLQSQLGGSTRQAAATANLIWRQGDAAASPSASYLASQVANHAA